MKDTLISNIEGIGYVVSNIFNKSGLISINDVKKSTFDIIKITVDELHSTNYNYFYWLALINRCSNWFWYIKNSNCAIPPPDIIVCPLGHNIYIDPVITPDGNTYDKNNLEIWVKKFNKEPITSNLLNMKDVIPNKQLKEIVEFIRIHQNQINITL
jgi:hypothetical protein